MKEVTAANTQALGPVWSVWSEATRDGDRKIIYIRFTNIGLVHASFHPQEDQLLPSLHLEVTRAQFKELARLAKAQDLYRSKKS